MKSNLLALAALVLVVVLVYQYGRSIWYPLYVKIGGKRTVAEVVATYGSEARSRLQPWFEQAGVAYPPTAVALLAIKEAGVLELWAEQVSGPVFIKAYNIEAHSGVAGPKLREGDKQVPEGVYQVTGLNPNSSFHLSLKLNYPNEFDVKHAAIEGRHEPGSNIFIHGKAVSVGCLAMGDTAIEELFVLASDVGHQYVRIIIAPTDPRLERLHPIEQLPWTAQLYEEITRELNKYSSKTSASSSY